jgi:hypothetical protein
VFSQASMPAGALTSINSTMRCVECRLPFRTSTGRSE